MSATIGASFSLPIAPLAGLIALPFVWRDSFGQPRRFPFSTWALGVAFTLLAAGGVLAWWSTQSSVLRFIDVPSWAFSSTGAIWAVIVGSAVANSIYEELLWRKLLIRAGVHRLVLIVGFGLAHINSLPDGALGVLLTAAFAVGAHWLVERSNGSIALPVAAHIVADVTILSSLLLQGGTV